MPVTHLVYEPVKHLVYAGDSFECTYYPSTRNVCIRNYDDTEFVTFNFDSLSEFVDYVRHMRLS